LLDAAGARIEPAELLGEPGGVWRGVRSGRGVRAGDLPDVLHIAVVQLVALYGLRDGDHGVHLSGDERADLCGGECLSVRRQLGNRVTAAS
jgi:hypothetical protein